MANKPTTGAGDKSGMLAHQQNGRRLRTKSTEAVETGTNARQRTASGVPVERKKRDSMVNTMVAAPMEKVPLKHRLSSKHRKMSAAVHVVQVVSSSIEDIRKKHAERMAKENHLKEDDEDDDDDDAKTNDDDKVKHFDEEMGSSSMPSKANSIVINTSEKKIATKKDDDLRGPVTTSTVSTTTASTNKPSPASTATDSAVGAIRTFSEEEIELDDEPSCVIEGYKRFRSRKLAKLGIAEPQNDLISDWASCSCFFSKVVPHSDVPAEGHPNTHKEMKSAHDLVEHKDAVEHEFNGIFLFGKPVYYFRLVNIYFLRDILLID